MIRALILSRNWQSKGGVVNVINTLASNFSENIVADRFIIGRRSGKNSLCQRVSQTVADAVRLAFAVKKNGYDLIQINPSVRIFSLLRDALFILVLRLMGASNLIVFFHGWNSYIINRINRNLILRMLFMRIIADNNAMIVLASQFKKELIDLGILASKIHVLTTMFSKDMFKGMKPKVHKNNRNLLFLSRIIKEKGVYELVDAFERVRVQFPDLKLTIAGDGPELNALTSYVDRKNLGNSVLFTGYVRNTAKAKVLLESDIYILPTYSEGCPVSLLEAMAAGLAVITSPVGGIPDIIDDGVNGILIRHPIPSQIATALRRLLSDKTFCKGLQANNHRKAWDYYEANIVTGIIENIYAQVVAHV